MHFSRHAGFTASHSPLPCRDMEFPGFHVKSEVSRRNLTLATGPIQLNALEFNILPNSSSQFLGDLARRLHARHRSGRPVGAERPLRARESNEVRAVNFN